jgi:hypothetical protein
MRLPKFDHLPFVLRLIIDPVRALDLLDGHTVPDHTKIIPFVVVIMIVALKAVHNPFTVMEDTVLLTAAFGQSMWRMFLREKTLTGTVAATVNTTLNETVTKQILERRDTVLGVDPTDD